MVWVRERAIDAEALQKYGREVRLSTPAQALEGFQESHPSGVIARRGVAT